MSLTILPRSAWTTTPYAWPSYPSRRFDKNRVAYLAPHYPAIAGTLGVMSEAVEQGWLRTVRRWHVQDNGWADIGYALVICQSGRTYFAGGITHSTAHAGSANPIAVGVLFLLGNDEEPTAAAVSAFNALGPWLRDTQGFTSMTIVRDHGRLPGQSTSCAGTHIRQAIDTGALALKGGSMNETQIRAAVVARAQSQVGKHYGYGGWTPYGEWYGPGWGRAFFCAAGWSWCWNLALGQPAAHNLIGHQTYGDDAPYGRGYIWTVALWVQHATSRVALRNLKPGDGLMFKYPTSGSRNEAVVNHIDVVESNNPRAGYIDAIGFNVPRPGAPPGTDQSLGGGVWRRRIWYNNPYVVGGINIPIPVGQSPEDTDGWSRVQRALNALGYGPFAGTGTYGPGTKAAVKDYAATFDYTGQQDRWSTLITHMEETMTTLDQISKQVADVRAKQDHLAKMLTAVGDSSARTRRTVSKTHHHLTAEAPEAFVRKLMGWPIYGLVFEWWVRRGLVPDPGHRSFPADPGSPADIELKVAAKALGETVTPYNPAKENS